MSYLVINATTPAVLKKTTAYTQACEWVLELIPGTEHAVVAPLERRSLTRFTELELRLLAKNSFPSVPVTGAGDYKAVLDFVYDTLLTMPEDNADFISKKVVADETPAPEPKASKTVLVTASSAQRPTPVPGKRPSGGVTAKVWAVCDELAEREVVSEFSPENWKTFRTTVVTTCTDLGVDPSTAATQYSRWKAATLAK